MSLEQANRYYYLAAQARQRKRYNIADALLRQAEREKDKEPMDVRDVANIQRDNANAMQNVAQPQQNVAQPQETPAVQETTPAVDQSQVGDGNPNVNPPAYQPNAEELANMADSEQFNGNNNVVSNAYNQNYTDLGVNTTYNPIPYAESNTESVNAPNGMIKPIPADQRAVPNLGGEAESPMRIYDPDVFAVAPPEGDEVWNTPEEQNARMLADKKKKKEIEELARQAEAAKIGEQYRGNNRVY